MRGQDGRLTKWKWTVRLLIFWCMASNYFHSKEALHGAKVECLEAEVEYLKSAVEGPKAEVQVLKAKAELLEAKTNQYDWFCTFECDHGSRCFSQISCYKSEVECRKAEVEYLKADINRYDWCCAFSVLRLLMVFIVMLHKKRLR